jgi:hypothetical protein
LAFTHPKQAIQKANVSTKAFKKKRKDGAIDYWISCGAAIEK